MIIWLYSRNVAPIVGSDFCTVVVQSVIVKGRVLDAEGIPVIGASVVEKRNYKWSNTEHFDGNYSLNVLLKMQ